MFAVIELGSFQFKVQEGDLIDAPKLTKDAGQNFDVESVLLVANGEDVRVGDPFVKGARVSFEVVRHFRDDKDIAFKFRRRKSSKSKKGHRQDLTALKVSKISV